MEERDYLACPTDRPLEPRGLEIVKPLEPQPKEIEALLQEVIAGLEEPEPGNE